MRRGKDPTESPGSTIIFSYMLPGRTLKGNGEGKEHERERNTFKRQRGHPVQTQRHMCSFDLNTEGVPGTSRGLVSLG